MTEENNGKPAILPAIIGNTLEWYDFTLYAYFATIFATLYFPDSNKFLSLLGVYGVLAASYFMRPVGALVFGYIGDKFGRRYSLSYSILLMGACSFLVSILPTYADWGIMAGISLAIIRLAQGFAVGGEYSGAAIYLIESAPAQKRSFFGSLSLASAYSGFLISSAVGVLLTFIFPSEILTEWGWRVGFALGGVLALIGLHIRKKLHNNAVTPPAEKTQQYQSSPLKDLLFKHPKTFLLALGMALLPAGFSYMIFVYIMNFLQMENGFTTQEIFYMNTLTMVFLVCVIPFIGLAADKIGRKTLMLGSAILILVLCIPLFQLTLQYALIGILALTLLNAGIEACLPAEIAEMFPAKCRYTGLALTLNLTNGVAGGLAPIIASTLFYTTGVVVSPMFYIIGLSLITLFSIGTQLRSYGPWRQLDWSKLNRSLPH